MPKGAGSQGETEPAGTAGTEHGSRKVGSTKAACKVPLPHLGLHPEGLNRENFQGNSALLGFSLGKEWGWVWSIFCLSAVNGYLGEVHRFWVTRAKLGCKRCQGFSIVLQYDCNQIFASTDKIPLFPLFLLFFAVSVLLFFSKWLFHTRFSPVAAHGYSISLWPEQPS